MNLSVCCHICRLSLCVRFCVCNFIIIIIAGGGGVGFLIFFFFLKRNHELELCSLSFDFCLSRISCFCLFYFFLSVLLEFHMNGGPVRQSHLCFTAEDEVWKKKKKSH